MATSTKSRPIKRPVQHPKKRGTPRRGRFGRVPALLVAAVIAVGAGLYAWQGTGGDGSDGAAQGLPNTPDYHSLLVSPSDANQILLGTHEGIYRSTDAGRTWAFAELAGNDAMNMAQRGGDTVWAAGHEVLARSPDGGASWQDVRPEGLPGLDVHGFAVDPREPSTVYAAIAGQGLFRSSDNGQSFALVSSEVGPGVMALAVTPDGRILAGEMERGLMVSADRGKTWKLTLEAGLMGLAVNPDDSRRIIATGPGILLSEDGGRNWRQVLPIEQSAGPVAWASSDPRVAYVVGFDRVLYTTADGGRTWRPVAEEG